MQVIYSGLPENAKKLLQAGMNAAYPGLNVELTAIDLELLEIEVLEGIKNTSVVYIVLDQASEQICKQEAGLNLETDKYIPFHDEKEFRNQIKEKLNLDDSKLPKEESLSLEKVIGVPEEDVNAEQVVTTGSSNSVLQDKIISNLQAQLEETELLLQYGAKNSDNDWLEEKSNSQTVLRDAKKLEESQKGYNKLKEEYESLRAALSSKEVELNDLYAVVNEQEGILEEEKRRYQSLESDTFSWKEEQNRKQLEIDQLHGTLFRVREERDKFKTLNETMSGELQALRMTAESSQKVKEAENELKNKYESLVSELNKIREESRGAINNLEKLTTKYNNIKSSYNSLQATYADNSKYLQEANEEILSLKGQIEGYILSEKGVTEQSKNYSELYENYLKLKSTIYNKIGSNAFPRTIGTLSLESLVNFSYSNSDIGFIFAGNSESQRNVYKFLREELMLCSSGVKSQTELPLFQGKSESGQTLVIDLSTESSLDYVFEVRGTVRSSIDWWLNGGGVQEYINTTCIRGVKSMMLGMGFNNDAFLLGVDWTERLKELQESGYKVIFVGMNMGNLFGRIIYNSLKENNNVIVGLDGMVTNTRNAIMNMSGFDTSKTTAVIIDKTSPASKFYSYLENLVRELKFYNLQNKR